MPVSRGYACICCDWPVFPDRTWKKTLKNDLLRPLLKPEVNTRFVPILHVIVLLIQIVIQAIEHRLVKSTAPKGIIRQVNRRQHTDTLSVEHVQEGSYLLIGTVFLTLPTTQLIDFDTQYNG